MIARDLSADAPPPRSTRRVSVSWSGPRLARNGQWELALRNARRLLERDPEHLGALEVAAQSLVALGHADECLAVVRVLVRLNPHEPAYELWRASSLQILARHSEALTALSRAYRLYRDPMVQAKVLEEMELLIGLLELGGREPTQLWMEAGLLPPQKRRGHRDQPPMVH